ncbi:MAG: tRNA 2-thiouridine(34) synthase MnmA [Oscillospiraceae bacterium]|nr:tRNA 2-thiouridine(34) synthase MnmA [Oscillospiraceae bacterium]
MAQKKAFIGMSGGVDSSVAAFLTQKQGFFCVGCTMRLHNYACGGADDALDALAVARKLGIDHQILPFQKEFEETVISDFVCAYESGLIPNPCICCNRHLKFGAMLDKALEMGFDYVISGHYARICRDETTGRYLLYKAADKSKDQTYFLAGLTQHQLSHILFPLGGLSKAEVRSIAEENGFLNARKRDSQDICFVPDGDYAAFLERYTGKTYPDGDYLDLEGNVVGRHRGAVRYTKGQRKGLGIALGAPVYVCKKDMNANTVTVGPNEALFSPALRARDWNWLPFPDLTQPLRVTAKTRHSQSEQPATVYPEENGAARVEFDAPQRAVTPGQAVVLYDGDMVIGGGTIAEAL